MNILLWIFIWYSAFAGYYLFFKKRDILYKNRPKLIIGWYALMGAIGFAVYHIKLNQVFFRDTTWSVLIGAIVVLLMLFFWYKALTKRDYVPFEDSRNIFFSKTSEIIFQQIMIWSLFGILQGVLLIVNPIILFAAIFFIFHIPLMMVISWKKGLLFTLASIIGGLVFAFCLSRIPSGWLIALALHIGFYACIASKRKIFGMQSFYVM